LGEKLRTLRLKDRKTLFEQSLLFGVSMNSVYRWECDLAIPRKATIKAMADYYDVSVDWITSESTSATLVSNVEVRLLNMYRKLSNHSRYKVLGYVERICIDDYATDVSDFASYVAEKTD